jgi:xylan 1,4-beta-xylosidase
MNRVTFTAILFSLVLMGGCKSGTSESKEELLKSHSKAIHIKDGWIRDPYIFLADDGFYYLTGTTPEEGDPREISDPYNTGLDHPEMTGKTVQSIVGRSIRVWKSADLLSWEYLGVKFTLDKGYWASVFPENFDTIPQLEWHLWAPEIYFANGKWMYIHTTPAPVKGGANLAITDGDDMNGPFSFSMGDDMRQKHDPSLFLDNDSTWYMLWGNTFIAPIKPGFAGLAAKPVRIDPSNRLIGHEGATLRKIGSKYVHFGTAWSTDKMRKGSYNLYYCLSDSVMGPYGPRRFVGRFLGHGTPFTDKEGRWWCTAFFNANVPPVSREGIQQRDLSDNAQTINEQGTTIVPLDVQITDDGDVIIRAKDPDYGTIGPDEAQKFE